MKKDRSETQLRRHRRRFCTGESQDRQRSANVMYTLHMSWSFRATVLGVLLSVGLAPQLACFMPDESVSQSDMDCCKEMIGACTAPNMSHECCQTMGPAQVGLTAKAAYDVMPRSTLVRATFEIAPESLVRSDRQPAWFEDPGPPHKHGHSSFVVLRI